MALWEKVLRGELTSDERLIYRASNRYISSATRIYYDNPKECLDQETRSRTAASNI